MQRSCPVCHQLVTRSYPRNNIEAHTDTLGAEECPASHEPWRIAIVPRARYHSARLRRHRHLAVVA